MPHLPVASSSTPRSCVVDLVARGQRLLEVQRADHVAQRRDGELLDRLERVRDLVGRRLRVGDGEVEDSVDLDHEVVLGDHRLRRERHDLFAQVDQGLEPVDERHQQRHARAERLVVAAEPLDDARAGLRDDPHRPREQDHEKHNNEYADYRSDHVDLPLSSSLFADQRGGALDCHHLNPLSRLDHFVIEGPSGPHLPVDPDAADALVVRDPFEHDGLLADQSG